VCCSISHSTATQIAARNVPLTAEHEIAEKTVQHTASHCNTLQHAATHCHCNTLQHPATNAPPTAAHDNLVAKKPAKLCNTLQHTATH